MKREYKLSRLIRFTALSLMLFLGILIFILILYNYNKNFSIISSKIYNEIISSKKQYIKDNVFQVISMINCVKSNTFKQAKNFAKNDVYQAINIAENIYTKFKNKYSEKEIEKIIVEAVRNLKIHSKNDYFFIVNNQGVVLLNANNPSLEQKNLFDLTDSQGATIIKDMYNIAYKNGEGFYSYFWHKPNQKGFYKKVSFVKYFYPMNFFIGKGVYVDEVEKNIQNELLSQIAAMRFGKEGYIFINKFDGTALISNGKLLKGNKKLWEQFGSSDNKTEQVKNIFKMALNAAKKENGDYIYYTWQKLTSDKVSKKISFIYGLKDWQWIIGTGIYLDDIEVIIDNLKKDLKQNLEKSIFILIVSILFLLGIVLFLTNKFSDFLDSELSNLLKLFDRSISENMPVNLKEIKIKEIKTFAKYLNSILNELKKSEEKFKKIFEESNIPMLILDKDRFIDCNNAAVAILKGEKKEDIFLHPAELSPKYQPDGTLSIDKARQVIQEVYETGKPKYFEWVHKRLNGEEFTSLISLSLIPYENKTAIFVSWLDISEIKRLHKEVEKEKEFLEVTIQSIGDAVISTDINGKVELMNKVAEHLTEWSIDEAYGKDLTEVFHIVNAFTREKVSNPVSKVLKTGRIVGLANHTVLVSKNGKESHIADSAAPIKDKNGKIIGVIMVFRDVTDLVKQEKELIKIEKLKSISVLAGGIAHDFNNILTGITGNLSLIKISLNQKSVNIAKILERIEKIEHSLERATNLTSQLLTFTKSGELIKESVNLNELIRKTTDFHLAGSKMKVIYDFNNTQWKLNADKGQLSHVIANLVINARDSMKQAGNIYISVREVENPEIFNKNIDGKYIRITIKDEGEGISKDDINRIFDPFFTTKEKGSGLGLSIVYSIIEKHYGYITCESEINKGTSFHIFLPFQKFEEEITLNENKSFDVSQYVKNVLILDDEESILQLLKDIFNFFGANSVVVENGEKAVEIFKKEQFDLIITDLTIPGGKGGKEIIDELLSIDPEAKVVVASGYSDDPVMSNYKEYGFKGRLKKPFTIGEIKEEIRKIFTSE